MPALGERQAEAEVTGGFGRVRPSLRDRATRLSIELIERGWVPEPLVRAGIRRLLAERLRSEASRPPESRAQWLEQMDHGPIALVPELANSQHYEVPPAFFERVLGRQLKYSSCLWPEGVDSLDGAEEAMLALTAQRAGLADGQRILELGCGWGSLSLWMARHFPAARIVAVSNSAPQRRFIAARAYEQGVANLTVLTADMNGFAAPTGPFDRIVSVEMFEHLRNWAALLRRTRGWLRDDGQLFLHVFAHRRFAYPFEAEGDDDWMGRHFFSGGMMPSLDLLGQLDIPFSIADQVELPGTHYARTAEAWQSRLLENRWELEELLARDLGGPAARIQIERWRVFFLCCAELFGYGGGSEWVVSHALLKPVAGKSHA